MLEKAKEFVRRRKVFPEGAYSEGDVYSEEDKMKDAIAEIVEAIEAHSRDTSCADCLRECSTDTRINRPEHCPHFLGKNKPNGVSPVTLHFGEEVSATVSPVPQDERSCRNCNLLVGCKVVLSSGQDCCDFWEQYVPRPKQPAQEQLTGRADGLCPKCMKSIGATTLCPFCGEHFEPYTQEQGGEVDWKAQYDLLAAKYRAVVEHLDKQEGTPCEQIRHEHEIADLRARLEQAEAKVNELTAELEKQKASAFETGELALKRGFEIERLEKEQGDILFLVQTRLQPPGSPCPGGPVMLVTWITGEAVKKIERLEKENAELKRKLSEVKP